jgi:hypothetical protein
MTSFSIKELKDNLNIPFSYSIRELTDTEEMNESDEYVSITTSGNATPSLTLFKPSKDGLKLVIKNITGNPIINVFNYDNITVDGTGVPNTFTRKYISFNGKFQVTD